MGIRLSNAVADHAKQGLSRCIIWDSELAGFGLRVSATGARTWIARYRAGGGRSGTQRQMTLGTYPKVSAPKARDAATKVLAAAALGADPVGERKAKRQGLTVAQLLELYEEEGC